MANESMTLEEERSRTKLAKQDARESPVGLGYRYCWLLYRRGQGVDGEFAGM
jgi:hypothetical protein